MTWATSVPILVFLGLSVLELRPIYATDRRQTDRPQTDRQTDRRQTSSLLNAPAPFLFTQSVLCHSKSAKKAFSAGAPPRTPLGELAMLPRPSSRLERGTSPQSPLLLYAFGVSNFVSVNPSPKLFSAYGPDCAVVLSGARQPHLPMASPQKFSARNAPVYNNATLLPLLSSCQ